MGHGVLTSADLTMIRLFMEPRGTTPYIGKDSPDQIGLWLGLQIIDHYMKSHPRVTIGELLHENDYEKILRESGVSSVSKQKVMEPALYLIPVTLGGYTSFTGFAGL